MEELLVKYLSGDASNEEKEQVLEWRRSSRENSEAFLSYKKTWAMTERREVPNPDSLASILNENVEMPIIIPLWKQRPIQVAAAMIIVLCGVLYFFQPNNSGQSLGKIVAVKTEFELPDGSKVTVQRGGSIDLINFNDEVREVELKGKAYFDIKRNESKPFLINTKGAIIRVLGTSFVVNSLADQHATEVMVESGVVAFSQNPKVFGGSAMEITLNRGEMGIIQIGERGIKKKNISDANYLAWQNGIITFKNSELGEVSGILEDVYNVRIDFENPILEKCNLTAKFNKKSADEVIQIIAETFSLKVSKNGKLILFDGQSCN
ncbi:MAG: FecR domain-containing protein [Marinoscillum sp.]